MPVKRPVCLICFIFLFVILIAIGKNGPQPSWDVDKASGRSISAVGKVVDRQEKNGTFQIFLKDISFGTDQAYFPSSSKGILVKFTESEHIKDRIKMGSRIEVRGVFSPFELPRCEGMFNAREYYLIRGYDGQLKRARLVGMSKGYDHISEILRTIRDNAYDIFKEHMSAEDAGLVAAMTLGDRTGLEADIKELYQRAGISHVLALSGLHIASVGLAFLRILKKAGLSSRIASVISFFFIASYSVMTGMSTSTVRAMIMFGLFSLASLLGRTYDLLSSAALSAVIILAFDPYYIYDTGFLLSFGAVCGIACIFPLFDSLPKVIYDFMTRKDICPKDIFSSSGSSPGYDRSNGGVAKKIYQSVCISLSVSISTLPIMGSAFMQIPVYSVVINLAVIPLMGLVLLTGFSAIIIGFLGLDPGGVLWITHYILWFFEEVGTFFEKIPGNLFLIGNPSGWQIITYAIIVIIAVIAWNIHYGRSDLITHLLKNVDRTGRCVSRDSSSYPAESQNKITYITESSSDRIVFRRRNFIFSLITLVMFVVAAPIFVIHPRSDLEIRNIDVGQGDCSLILGKGLPVIMIDGGSSDIKQVGKNRILPVLKANRIPVIDYCFLTHMDSDHVNGVIDLIADSGCGISFKTVIISSASSTESENYIRLCREAGLHNVRIVVIKAGDRLHFDGSNDAGIDLICINPVTSEQSPVISNNTDENDSSIVLKAEYRSLGFSGSGSGQFTALFTGDISEEVEKAILSFVPDCTYLKVAHHGSRNSSSRDFLQKSSPEISVISAGVDNSYGHPHKETLKRLKDARSRIYCTQDLGEITLRYNNGTLTVETCL